jgi:hypothetical protein
MENILKQLLEFIAKHSSGLHKLEVSQMAYYFQVVQLERCPHSPSLHACYMIRMWEHPGMSATGIRFLTDWDRWFSPWFEQNECHAVTKHIQNHIMLNTGFYSASSMSAILHIMSRLKLLAHQNWTFCVLGDEWRKTCLAVSQHLKLRVELFMANKYAEIFSGDQPCHG